MKPRFDLLFLAIVCIVQTIIIVKQHNVILKLEDQIKTTSEQLNIFKELSFSLSDHCIELEKHQRASCNPETKECQE